MSVKAFKWDTSGIYPKIENLFGIHGATFELRYEDKKVGNKYIPDWRYGFINFKNDNIHVEKQKIFSKRNNCILKSEGKKLAEDWLMQNRYLYIDMMRADNEEEKQEILQQTIDMHSSEKLHAAWEVLNNQKMHMDKIYNEKKAEYIENMKTIQTPIGYKDVIVGEEYAGTKQVVESRVTGYTESGDYHALPDKQSRSSFESPDYEQVKNRTPIIQDVLVEKPIFYPIMGKKPIFKTIEEPHMPNEYKNIIHQMEIIENRLENGENRKIYIEENADKYNIEKMSKNKELNLNR